MEGGELPANRGQMAKRRRLVLCHLDSLVCLPGINELFSVAGDQISLVLLSDRFGGSKGSALGQFLKGVRRSGFSLTFWLGFDIIAARIVDSVSGHVCRIARRPRRLRGIRTLTRIYGSAAI